MHLYVRIDLWIILKSKRKQQPPPGDDASMVEAAPVRVWRDEQGEARRANTAQNGGAHLEVGCLRLKTWSKSDFSIAETGQHLYTLQGGFHRGGLTPALAPRMPVITEDE